MAYFKITTNKKGEMVARIQVSGKDLHTGEPKLYTKRVYNEDNLTEAKFRKLVDKTAILFEEEVATAYKDEYTTIRTKVLTFSELMKEWKQTIKNNLSISYLLRAEDAEIKFNRFLKEQRLADRPISEIRVRDVQMFLNSFAGKPYTICETVKLKKMLPDTVNFRELAREKILSRNASYYMKKGQCNITKQKAIDICSRYHIDVNEYFDIVNNTKQYSVETIKGYRRVLRTLFNEAVRYEWIVKNPVCGTKVSAGNSNTCLRPIQEKEVYSIKEAQEFLQKLNDFGDKSIHKTILAKLMLLTGMRNAEVHGLRWNDIDFENKVVHVRRNRIYAPHIGVYEKSPKTKTSLRDIPMPASLIADLKHFQDWFREADKDFDNKLNEYYVAVNVEREPIIPDSLGCWLSRFQKQNGLKHVSCHGLRHTYCSILLAQNVPIQTVSKYMGHSDSTITLQVYSHFIPDTQNRALSALETIIKKDGED